MILKTNVSKTLITVGFLIFGIIFTGLISLLFFNNTAKAQTDLTWTHLSSDNGDLDPPSQSDEQTASLVLDINKDNKTDFVIGIRQSPGPSLVWYRQDTDGWTKHIIDNSVLPIEAGGAYYDIDDDGDLDIVMAGDWSSNEIWWWENPYPTYDVNTSWTRRLIKNSGSDKHHDQIFGDFDDDGDTELVFWNQEAEKLFMAEIPADPKTSGEWVRTEIYSWSGAEHEGFTTADVDGDGVDDIVGGGRWFKHNGGYSFTANAVHPDPYTRAAAAQLIPGGRPELVFVPGDAVGPLVWYQWDSSQWVAHELVAAANHGHSLQIDDVNKDGHLDIFNAEMRLNGNNDTAKMRLFLGDSTGSFTETEISSGYGNHESRLADLDGDGYLDILGKPYNWDTPRVDIWLNDLSVSLDAWERHVVDAETDEPWKKFFITNGDINGDQLEDIITGAWWYQNPGSADGAWTSHTIGSPLNNMAAVYDFDGDGDLDILGTEGTSANANDSFVWAENDGSGNFTIRQNVPNGDGDFLQGVAVGNFQNATNTEVMLSWHAANKGIQRLTVPDDPAAQAWAWEVISSTSQDEDLSAGDIDRDHDLDLLMGTAWQRNDLANELWSGNRRYRLPISVDANGVVRQDKPVEVTINFTPLLQGLGESGALSTDSIRVVEVDGAGLVLDANVPFQFDPDADFNAGSKASGTVVFLMVGDTGTSGTRSYHIYFDTTAGSFSAPAVKPFVTLTDNVMDAGQNSYQVDTNEASYYYHKQGGGFSSLVDVNSNDWINHNTTAGSAGMFRGVPNLVYPGDIYHPGFMHVVSEIVHTGPIKATVRSVSNDGEWEVEWAFYPDYATLSVLKINATKKYWFLYEGTPGGSLDLTTDIVVRSDGTQTTAAESWTGDLAGEEWVYFGDGNLGRSLFVASHQEDEHVDSYYQMENNMTVFGLGRDGTNKHLVEVPAYFTIGLMDETAYDTAQPIVRGAYQSVVVIPGSAEARPAGDDDWSAVTLFNQDLPDRNRLADMNGNGRLDAVVGYEPAQNSTPGKLAWYEQGVNATDLWTEHVISDTLIGPMSLDVADMDNDGDFDVVVGEHNTQNPATAKLFVFENVTGQGDIWEPHLVFTGDEHHDGAQVVDIDGDGDMDIISIGWNHNRVLLYENLAGPSSPPDPTPTPDPDVTVTPTPIPSPTPLPPPRVEAGLEVLYTFREGSGSIIHDVSEDDVPLDLTINSTGTSWISGGGLSLDSSAQISSLNAASLVNACQATNELTVEAWIKPASASQGGPARIVSLSDGSSARNFTLGHGRDDNGQAANWFGMRLRTSDSANDNNGKPGLESPGGSATTNLTHLVYTFEGTGGADNAKIYINSVNAASDTIGGDLSNWNPNYPLLLGNETTWDRPWLGEIYLVAVYCDALTSAEVEQNFEAGALPIKLDEFNYLPTIIKGDGAVNLSYEPLLLKIETFFVDVADWFKEQFD